LPQTDSFQASGLSRRIGVVFTETLRPLDLMVSVSMDHGISTYPQDGDKRDQLILIADERLYSAKQASKTVAEAPPDVAQRAVRDAAAEAPQQVAPEMPHEVAPEPTPPSEPVPSAAPEISQDVQAPPP